LLKGNLERNAIRDVRVVEAAVSDHTGTIPFWVNKRSPGGSTSTQEVYETKSQHGGDYTQLDVPSVLLSDFIEREVDLLKIDIEGAEGSVIAELERSGKLGLIRDIIMEYHYNPDNQENSLPKLIDTLEKNGFRILVFANEMGLSSEDIKKMKNYHFLMRAVNTRPNAQTV
jgi:FkbM family methyltransferase